MGLQLVWARHSHLATVLAKEPIYQQLNSHLRRMITAGEIPIGGKFPTERQICDRFGVSRATANKALLNLVSDGLLEFRKGIGTFVKVRSLDYSLRALVSFTEKAHAAGRRPSTEVPQFQAVRAEDVLDDVPAFRRKHTRLRCAAIETARRRRRNVDPVGGLFDWQPPLVVGAHAVSRRLVRVSQPAGGIQPVGYSTGKLLNVDQPL